MHVIHRSIAGGVRSYSDDYEYSAFDVGYEVLLNVQVRASIRNILSPNITGGSMLEAQNKMCTGGRGGGGGGGGYAVTYLVDVYPLMADEELNFSPSKLLILFVNSCTASFWLIVFAADLKATKQELDCSWH